MLVNLKIGQRLAVVLACVLVISAAIAGAGWWGVDSLHTAASRALVHDVKLAQEASDIQMLVLLERRYEKDALINLGDAEKLTEYTGKWQDVRTRLTKAIEHTRALELGPEDAQAIAQLGDHFGHYARGFESTLSAIAAGQIKTTADANADLGKVKAAVRGMEAISDAVADRAMQRAGKVQATMDAVRARAVTLLLVLSALGLAAAALLSWLLARSITLPIREAVRIAETVAAGDLSSRIHVGSRDEVGQLLAALGCMNENLTKLVGKVRDGSDSIATGTAQIATGNADLSQRTEEQASNLQQTAASMEQLTATVRQNAEAAREATRLAGSATAVATRGGEVVGQVVATMGDIAASSHRIAEIIGVVDGIAFQTNILALNAAVEAARAGEQGRGFAVVAGEVRSLAQRSAHAAREIKTLIGESVQRVESGGQLVHEAGETMNEIVVQVRRVNDLIAEIGSASAQQSSGIEQIGEAVSQLDQVTQQNAALVEESAAAAESLKAQAVQLAEIVAVFKLAVEPAAAAATSVADTPVMAAAAQPARDTSCTTA
ncbi:methyl-accepting chemotaxis protein [Piscinibacter sp. XHJ-5]|uniref:methyl-accepting chemotaxis protein n=1 Tax=Piscinibacter sp. XHJ-5 TaxID=3037797 RepID=UPI002452965B|nr:methyl-accepting chemotaxis protein [Piscinibacter sp. XHJ-5]